MVSLRHRLRPAATRWKELRTVRRRRGCCCFRRRSVLL